ncbi:hypothetical protein ACFQ0M_39550 [Kitasatospora aburaviensis]
MRVKGRLVGVGVAVAPAGRLGQPLAHRVEVVLRRRSVRDGPFVAFDGSADLGDPTVS